MGRSLVFTISPLAAAELSRQASFAGTPGIMHIDLQEDNLGEGWLHIRIRPGIRVKRQITKQNKS